LRAHLRLRSALVTTVGVLGGLATGAILAALIVALVTLTAAAGNPEPPLLLDVDWTIVALGLVIFLVVTTALVGITTRQAFRAEVAGRFVEAGT
jgi:CDP-diglyceride synthetase